MSSGDLSLHQCLAAEWPSLNIMARLASVVSGPPVSISSSPSVAQAKGRERALDGVGGPQVSPVLCGEVVGVVWRGWARSLVGQI